MKKKRPKLPKDKSKSTTFHYNTRSSSRKGYSTVDEWASLRVTKQGRKKLISDEQSSKSHLYLPIDLIVEILRRLPVKTLARFLCVSKVWSSTIRSRNFTKLFVQESWNRPSRLFFTFTRKRNCYVFSLDQIPNTGEATYHLTRPEEYKNTINSSSCVHDLICYRTTSFSKLVVYNSTTKRSITLPRLEPPGSRFFKQFLGYDPINGVYKVLCMCTNKERHIVSVLTLGLGNENQWRILKHTRTHFPFMNSQICINGVLYYDAYVNKEVVVMSFDVRSAKFHLIKGPAGVDFLLYSLARYEGKICIISYEVSANGSMVLWVLEDALKQEWLKKVFLLPNSWKNLAHDIPEPPPHKFHYFLNITVAGEFILAPVATSVVPFYVLYYDPKRNSIRKVLVEGIREHELYRKEKSWFMYHLFFTQAESGKNH